MEIRISFIILATPVKAMIACFVLRIRECANFLAEGVEDSQYNTGDFRKLEADRGFGVEGVGVVWVKA